MKSTKQFKVAMKSENTNSFGLYQMILIAKDGEAFKSHASMYNHRPEGSIVNLQVTIDLKTAKRIDSHFIGHELTTSMPKAPQEVIDEVW